MSHYIKWGVDHLISFWRTFLGQQSHMTNIDGKNGSNRIKEKLLLLDCLSIHK